MSLKNQIRAARDPAAFIQGAQLALRKGEEPFLIPPELLESMTVRVLETVDATTPKEFNALLAIATHDSQGSRLHTPFYRAAQQGLKDIAAEKQSHVQRWPEFFRGIASALRSDAKLRAIVANTVVRKELPAMVWAVNRNERDVDAATGIIQALDDVPNMLDGLDPEVATALVRAHLESAGSRVAAAPKLSELRSTPAFATAIASNENEAGVHVAAYKKNLKIGPYTRPTMYVVEFTRSAGGVNVHQVNYRGGRYQSALLMNGDGVCPEPHKAAVADVLLEHSYAALPEQEWVVPLAESSACRLG